jgi:hypothetical protein
MYSDLHKLFDAAVGAYREQLRKRVEADATRHFKALTTEPEYAGLRINDSYGLTIVHRDVADIPVRSAGAEHVVALCLMGALQNNAPLRGPIVIDSPFGRLDRGHTRNIVRALPTMTKQIVLLVYEDELPPDLVRTELKSKLRSEWHLERRSARHTSLLAALVSSGRFGSELDAAKFAMAYAIKSEVHSGSTEGAETTWNVGSVDPDGSLRSLLEALYPTVSEPYRLLEHLMNEGIKVLSSNSGGNPDLYDTLFAGASGHP